MKTNLYILGFIAVLAVSCSKSAEQKQIGKWDFAETQLYIVNSIFVSDTTETKAGATISFRTGNAGTKSYTDSSTTIEWFLNNDTLITITEQGEEPSTYRILLNENNEQLWYLNKKTNSSFNGIDATEEWTKDAKLVKR